MIPRGVQIKSISLGLGLAIVGNSFHASKMPIMPVPQVPVDQGSIAWFSNVLMLLVNWTSWNLR